MINVKKLLVLMFDVFFNEFNLFNVLFILLHVFFHNLCYLLKIFLTCLKEDFINVLREIVLENLLKGFIFQP